MFRHEARIIPIAVFSILDFAVPGYESDYEMVTNVGQFQQVLGRIFQDFCAESDAGF
jgi:hypothetical protein